MKRSQLQIIALCTWNKRSSKENKRVQENDFVNVYRLNDPKNKTWLPLQTYELTIVQADKNNIY